jgi:tagatose-1,6-bisphosphate aldolase
MEEAGEIQALVAAVVASHGSAARSCYDRYKAIVSAVCNVFAASAPLLDQACGKPSCTAALHAEAQLLLALVAHCMCASCS